MAQYMLLLRRNSDAQAFSKLGPEEMQQVIEKYVAWRHKPFVTGGAGLVDDGSGRVIRKKNGGMHVTEGPFSESKEVLAGYYTIEAADLEEAVKFSSDNPHFDFGTIEIREVKPN